MSGDIVAGHMSEQEAFAIIQKRITSREWWFIIATPETLVAHTMMADIEARFYSGEANRDFEVIIAHANNSAVVVAMAKKCRAPAELMERFLKMEIASGMDCMTTPDCPIWVPRWLNKTFNWQE